VSEPIEIVMVRVPAGLKRELEQRAALNLRSVSMEVRSLIARELASPPAATASSA
jgi:hypothetical protein